MDEKEIMTGNTSEERDYEQEIIELLQSGLPDSEISEKLSDYHDNDIAGAIEELDEEQRNHIFDIIGEERAAEILAYVEDSHEILAEMPAEEAAKFLENMDTDDAIDILENMDEETAENLVELMEAEAGEDIRLIQSYDEEEIGSRMTTNFVVIRNDLNIRSAMKELIKQAGENDNIMTIYVVDEKDAFYGAIDLKDLIVARDTADLSELIITSYPYLTDHEIVSDCIERIKSYAEDSIPVLNEEGHILGVITSQDIVEAVDDELGEDYAKLAGLSEEEDLNEKTSVSIRKRIPWLIALLLLGMLTSTLVGAFEGVIAAIPVVIAFQSLILSMSGNVGTQSLAVTIRVIADEDLTMADKVKLIFKEGKVGFGNGLILGIISILVVGIYIHFAKGEAWNYSVTVSVCVGFAMLVAMLVASITGTIIPLFFNKIKVAPAAASGPFISTLNDILGVALYYGLCWFLLIKVFSLGGV
ncbi:MAG: magnesium transporter [Lachnospiraceae bacterium]|nr:magnesium transporter [Clostridiales bacterium]MBP3754734.1 magnesium transporter [Lachnospiraceae bacterium]